MGSATIQGMNVSSKVPAAFDGILVTDYLATRFTYLTIAAWRALLNEGKVSCNGSRCDATTTVAGGDVVACELPPPPKPEVNLDYRIVYQDEWLLGIAKPPGLRVHSGGRFVAANLIYHLRHCHRPPFPEAGLANRLDADTSGLVLLGRSPAVLRQLMHQFAEGSVVKRYLAVVSGRPSPASGRIDLPIGPERDARVPRFKVDPVTGKEAATRYRTLRDLPDCRSLLELRPETGRTHQLRVHLAAIGHPIAGDALYTMNDDDYLSWRRNPPCPTGLQRQALHCYQMQFLHPVRHIRLTLTAPLTADIAQLIGEALPATAEQ